MSLDILQTILAGDVQEERRDSVVAPIIQEGRCLQHQGAVADHEDLGKSILQKV